MSFWNIGQMTERPWKRILKIQKSNGEPMTCMSKLVCHNILCWRSCVHNTQQLFSKYCSHPIFRVCAKMRQTFSWSFALPEVIQESMLLCGFWRLWKSCKNGSHFHTAFRGWSDCEKALWKAVSRMKISFDLVQFWIGCRTCQQKENTTWSSRLDKACWAVEQLCHFPKSCIHWKMAQGNILGMAVVTIGLKLGSRPLFHAQPQWSPC